MFELSNPIKNNFVTEKITNIYLSGLKLRTIFKKDKDQANP